MSDLATPKLSQPKRRLRLGLGVSIVVHSCLIVALVIIPYRMYVANRGAKQGPPTRNSPGGEFGNRDDADLAARDEETRLAPKEAAQAEKIMTDKVEMELTTAISQAEQRPSDENLAKLEQLTDKLNRVSNEKSVDELSQKLQGWLKTEERATEPAKEPPPGEFDYNTAQFYDVKRVELPEGKYGYHSVLLDAAGRTVVVELAESEGESMYRMFSLFKTNPLAEKLYRGVTMSLLDKLVKAAEQAANAPGDSAPGEKSLVEPMPNESSSVLPPDPKE